MTDEGAGDGSVIVGLRARVADTALAEVLRRSGELGFLGSMPVEDQISHALGFVAILEAELREAPPTVIDLGSGGGVPGLVLIACWPESRVVLMDASERRCAFLDETLSSWGRTTRGEVVRGRAEELGRRDDLREYFGVVTSRSFGLPAATAECGSAFLSPTGLMVVSEPPDADRTQRWPEEGLSMVALERLEAPADLELPFGYQVLRKVSGLEERYPRRVGIPVKRPLF